MKNLSMSEFVKTLSEEHPLEFATRVRNSARTLEGSVAGATLQAAANHIETLLEYSDQENETVVELLIENTKLMKLVEFLWDIIDDIDTASDLFKADDVAYRRFVEKKQAQRWLSGIETDGHNTLNIEAAFQVDDSPQTELNFSQPTEAEQSVELVNKMLGKLA